MKVVTLGEHLSADEHVDLAAVEGEQHAVDLTLAFHCVAVDAGDAEFGELFFEYLLYLLRALADEV